MTDVLYFNPFSHAQGASLLRYQNERIVTILQGAQQENALREERAFYRRQGSELDAFSLAADELNAKKDALSTGLERVGDALDRIADIRLYLSEAAVAGNDGDVATFNTKLQQIANAAGKVFGNPDNLIGRRGVLSQGHVYEYYSGDSGTGIQVHGRSLSPTYRITLDDGTRIEPDYNLGSITIDGTAYGFNDLTFSGSDPDTPGRFAFHTPATAPDPATDPAPGTDTGNGNSDSAPGQTGDSSPGQGGTAPGQETVVLDGYAGQLETGGLGLAHAFFYGDLQDTDDGTGTTYRERAVAAVRDAASIVENLEKELKESRIFLGLERGRVENGLDGIRRGLDAITARHRIEEEEFSRIQLGKNQAAAAYVALLAKRGEQQFSLFSTEDDPAITTGTVFDYLGS